VLTTPDQRRELQRTLKPIENLVIRSLAADQGQPLLSIVPLAPESEFSWPQHAPAGPIRLSRFAQVTADGGWVVESPLALHRAILHSPQAVSLIAPLSRPVDPATVAPDLLWAARYLIGAGLVVEAQGEDRFGRPEFAEDNDPALTGWTPVDLMFHTRSTLGRHDNDFGATGSQDADPDEPVVQPAAARALFRLPDPARDDAAQIAVDAARPTRHFSDRPVTLTDLGELLHRTARIRRPNLAGTTTYELELYAVVNACDDLPAGLYHYEPEGHRLEAMPASADDLAELNTMAQVEANLEGQPAVTLLITARFRRLSWTYAGLAYSVVLKDVGALMQSLMLASAALGLACCGLYSPNIERSARILGTDWRVESMVGGFVAGHGQAA